jgi:hypothetical protein
MPDNSIHRSIEDNVQRLIELYRENPDYFQGRVSQVFEQWKDDNEDAAPTPDHDGGFLRWFGSRLPPAYAFRIGLTETDKRLLRDMGIKP